MTLSSHQSANAKSTTYLTPPEILAPLGDFDLDPCAAPSPRPWPTAARHIELPEDGLSAVWEGRVFCNPPFGREAAAWLAKMAAHGNGIALVPARTETAMFYRSVWGVATGVLFLRGRPHFCAGADCTVRHGQKIIHVRRGQPFPFNSGAPICLIAYGESNAAVLAQCGLGHFAGTKLYASAPPVADVETVERIAAECGAVIGYTGPGGVLTEAAFSRAGPHEFARRLTGADHGR